MKQLINRIESFLETKVESDGGGYAPVDRDDFHEFWGICEDILSHKWAADVDGDVPVAIHLTDVTKYRRIGPVLLFHNPSELQLASAIQFLTGTTEWLSKQLTSKIIHED